MAKLKLFKIHRNVRQARVKCADLKNRSLRDLLSRQDKHGKVRGGI